MTTHSSILAWRIPWAEEPGRLLSMEFSRQEYCSGLPYHTPGDLPDPRIKPTSLCVSCTDRQILYHCSTWEALFRFMKMLVSQSCPTLCDPMNCSPSGSSAHGILQARILEWVAISFFRESSQPRDRTQVFCGAGRFFTV